MRILCLLSVVVLSIASKTGCHTVAVPPIDEPVAANMDDRIIGRWKFEEDTNRNNFYEVMKGYEQNPHKYHVKFWNRGGMNATYESNIHFSKVGNVTFLNVPHLTKTSAGFMFLRVLEVNSDMSRMTTATVYDPVLEGLSSSADIKKEIMAVMNDPRHYVDTVHFYKMK